MFVNLMGKSGVGKDIIQKMLTIIDERYVGVKFAQPMKDDFERRYNLPRGAAESRAVKSTRFGTTTGLDIMIQLWRCNQGVDPSWSMYSTMREVHTWQQFNHIPVFTDCRNYREMDFLTPFPKGVHVRVESTQRGHVKESDLLMDELWQAIPAHHHKLTLLNNTTTKSELLDQVEGLHLWLQEFLA